MPARRMTFHYEWWETEVARMFLGSKNIDPSAGKLGMHSKTIVRNWPVQKFVRAAIVGLAAAVVMTPVASLAAKAEGALASPNSSLLMCGNPTRGTGYFANSHKHNRGDYETLHFRSSDSPLVDPGYRDGLVRKFGEDSNVVRVRADGEFPRADDDTLIPLDLVEAAIMRERNPEDGQRRLGIDVARFGDDRTVFVLRAGPNVEHVRIEGKRDTMEVVGIAVKLIKQWRAQTVCIDTIGIGSGVYDRLTEIKKRKEVDNNGDPLVPPFVQLVAVNVAERAPIRA